MENLRWEEEDGSFASFRNETINRSSFVLERADLQVISNSTSVSSYADARSSSLDYNDRQGHVEDDLDCFGCGGGFSLSGFGNQSEDTVNGTANFTTTTTTTEEDNGLYQIPLHFIVMWCILYGGITLAAIFGNALVMWVVVVSRRMRTVTNMFIANLALADFVIGFFAIPFQVQAALLQRWNLPDFLCAFCPFLQVLSVNVSVFTLCAIAMDRHRAVLYPLNPQISKRKATWIIFSIWVGGIVIALPTELDYEVTYHAGKDGTLIPFCSNAGLSDVVRMYYSVGLLLIQYVIPLIIILIAYARMATSLWGTTVPGNKEESRDAIVMRNKKKVIKTIALVVLLFAICWLPLQLYTVLQFFFPSINSYRYINMLFFIFHWIAMGNSAVNFVIYATKHDKFQREFRERLGCLSVICKCGCGCGKHGGDEENLSDASDEKTKLTSLTSTVRKKKKPGERRSKQHRTDGNNKSPSFEMTTEFNQKNGANNCATDPHQPSSGEQAMGRKNRIANCRRNDPPEDKVAHLSLNNENVKGTSTQQLMKNDNHHNASNKLPPSGTQTAVVCSNSSVPTIAVTVIANDGMCEL